jgi:hypothetical protein
MGSGIPQVVRALEDDLPPSQRAWLVSLRVSLHKIGLVSGGLLAGLSIGRGGPDGAGGRRRHGRAPGAGCRRNRASMRTT